jgi:hypothetical protein
MRIATNLLPVQGGMDILLQPEFHLRPPFRAGCCRERQGWPGLGCVPPREQGAAPKSQPIVVRFMVKAGGKFRVRPCCDEDGT